MNLKEIGGGVIKDWILINLSFHPKFEVHLTTESCQWLSADIGAGDADMNRNYSLVLTFCRPTTEAGLWNSLIGLTQTEIGLVVTLMDKKVWASRFSTVV